MTRTLIIELSDEEERALAARFRDLPPEYIDDHLRLYIHDGLRILAADMQQLEGRDDR